MTALFGLPHLRIKLEHEASPAMATTTAPPAQPPSYGGLHSSASAACFL
jgi:hypothetical protein